MTRAIYERAGIFKIDDVLPYVVFGKKDFRDIKEYLGHPVVMSSQRYQLFAAKGLKCVACGLEGTFFALEKSFGDKGDKYHFNLYAIKDGKEEMITKDHIFPKSKGGYDELSNYQVMCDTCNRKKGMEEV